MHQLCTTFLRNQRTHFRQNDLERDLFVFTKDDSNVSDENRDLRQVVYLTTNTPAQMTHLEQNGFSHCRHILVILGILVS